MITRKATNRDVKESVCYSLHPGVEVLFSRLGIISVLNKSTISRYSKIVVNGKSNTLGNRNEKWSGFHVCRSKFYNELQRCLELHSIPLYKKSLKRSDIIITEDSVSICLSKSSHLNATYCLDCSGKSRILSHQSSFHSMYYSVPLYCWSGTQRNRSINDRFDSRGRLSIDGSFITWQAQHSRGIDTYLRITKCKDLLKHDINQGKYFGIELDSVYNVTWRLLRPTVGKNYMFAGDAAALIDPGAGQGVMNAMITGSVAAKHLYLCMQQHSQAELYKFEYDRWLMNYFESKVEILQREYLNLGFNVTMPVYA